MKKFETPFGGIPISFEDALNIFPFAMATLFLICSSFLISAIRIRKEFHFFYKDKNSNKYKLINKEIHNIAPLWFDPVLQSPNRKFFFIILLLPLFIFLFVSGLIFYNWILTSISNGSSSNAFVYLPLYIATLLGISQDQPKEIVNDFLYKYLFTLIDIHDSIGLNILKIFGMIDLKQLNLSTDSNISETFLQLHRFIGISKMNSYAEPIKLIFLVLIIVPFSSFIFIITSFLFFLLSLIIFVYSYRNIFKEYFNYERILTQSRKT